MGVQLFVNLTTALVGDRVAGHAVGLIKPVVGGLDLTGAERTLRFHLLRAVAVVVVAIGEARDQCAVTALEVLNTQDPVGVVVGVLGDGSLSWVSSY